MLSPADRVAAQTRLSPRVLSDALKPICVRIVSSPDSTTFRSYATGFLFSVGGLRFLISAGHIFDDGPPDLWLENAIRKKRLNLIGQRWLVDDAGGDLAIVELRDDVVAALDGMRFLTIQDVDFSIAPDRLLTISGFPVEWNAPAKDIRTFSYTTTLYKGSTAGIPYDPNQHILLSYNLSFSVGEDGTIAGMPDGLHGMSGCPVWMLDPMQPLTPASLRLVGVETGTIRRDSKACSVAYPSLPRTRASGRALRGPNRPEPLIAEQVHAGETPTSGTMEANAMDQSRSLADAIAFFPKAFTIVMALALGESFKQFVADKAEKAEDRTIHWDRLPTLLSFLLLILPFYQGMSR